MVLWPIRARVLFELFYKGFYCTNVFVVVSRSQRCHSFKTSNKIVNMASNEPAALLINV